MFNKVVIHKDNLINNVKQVKNQNLNSKICAMVKANAYGVGVKQVVQILEDYVDFFGVACFFEAKDVAKLTNKPIIIVGAFEKDCVFERFSYACETVKDVEEIIKTNKPIKVHLKVNTGMNRFGFKEVKEFKKALKLISKSKVVLEGVFTHFATCDEFVEKQMNCFLKFLKFCPKDILIHADSSFVNLKYNHNLDMVRIGFNLFNGQDNWFLPVREIKSQIVQVNDVKKGELVGYANRFIAKKKTKVAVVPIGYADGFDLRLVGFDLLFDSVKCKVLNVCMDCFMLDITDTKLKKGDEIYVLNKFNSLKHFADYLQTSEYEIGCKFSNIRADRVIV